MKAGDVDALIGSTSKRLVHKLKAKRLGKKKKKKAVPSVTMLRGKRRPNEPAMPSRRTGIHEVSDLIDELFEKFIMGKGALKGKGFGVKKRRAAFFARLKGQGLRFRLPSARTVSGATSLQKIGKRRTGFRKATVAARAPTNIRRRLVRLSGWESRPARLARHGIKTPFGIKL